MAHQQAPLVLILSLFYSAISFKACAPHESTHTDTHTKPHSLPILAHTCKKEGVPKVEAVYTAEGVLLWELGMVLPRKNVFYDAIEIHGQNLCSGSLTMGDGFSIAKPLPYTIIEGGNIKVTIPWGLERITQSIVFRTTHSFTRVDFHFIPIDKLNRQIFVRKIKSDEF